MVGSDEAEKIALGMPECTAGAHQGHPDFRVRGQIFMTLWPDEHRAVIRLAEADQTALVAGDPDTFSLPGWAHPGWTNVDLRQLDADRFRELVTTAWRFAARPGLAAAQDDDPVT